MTQQTPKQRFMESNENITAHRRMVDLREFQRACDFAQLEYQRLLAEQVKDGNTSAWAGLKLQGALEFMQQFRMLSETEQVPKRAMTPQLNHNA